MFWVGLLANVLSGVFIVLAFYEYGNSGLARTSEVFNVVPDLISAAFLIDALRRLKSAASGVFQIEIWQMVWHVWAFVLFGLGGIVLSVTLSHPWSNPEVFYYSYEMILVLVFMCELPFIYIIHRLLTQAIMAQNRLKDYEQEVVEEVD